MSELLWFHGIGWHTQMGGIGWIWLAAVLLVLLLIGLLWKLWRTW